MAANQPEQTGERTRWQKTRAFLRTFEFKTIVFAAAYFWLSNSLANREDLLVALSPKILIGIYAGLLAFLTFFAWINIGCSDDFIRKSRKYLRIFSFVARFCLPFFIGLFCMQAYVWFWTDENLSSVIEYVSLHADYTEAFYTSISTLYAIITALALVHVLEKFDELKKNVENEPHVIRHIHDMTSYFERYKSKYKGDYINSAIRSIKQSLHDYADNVARLRDRDMARGNTLILRELRFAISKLNPRDYNDQVALSKIIEQQKSLSTLRIKRINSLKDKIPGMLILMLWLVSGALILPFLAKPLYIEVNANAATTSQPIKSEAPIACRPAQFAMQMSPTTPATKRCDLNPDRYGQYYMIILMGTLYSFLLLMLQDISNPLDGFWQLNKQPFEDLATELHADLRNTAAKVEENSP